MLFLTLPLVGLGQYYYGGLAYTYPQTQFAVDSSGNVRFQPGDLGFTMQAGAFAGTNFNGNSWFGTSVSPALAYNISPRFRLKAGVSIMQGFGDNLYYSSFDRYYTPMNTSGTTTSVFVRGDYILSNKIMLSGAAYKYFSPLNIHSNDPGHTSPEGEGFMFNVNYRPTKSVEINASIEYNRGRGSFFQDPFYQPFNQPFNPPFRY